MTDVLDVCGLACVAAGLFLAAVWVGLVAVGAGCLLLSWSLTRKATKVAKR